MNKRVQNAISLLNDTFLPGTNKATRCLASCISNVIEIMVVFLLIDAFTEKHDSKISDIGDEDFFNRTPSVPLDDKVVLLNIRKNVFKDVQFIRLVKRDLEAKMEFVLVHEQDSKESCEFKQIIDETPDDLLARGIFNNIAVPFYAKEEYRAISMYLLLEKISDVYSSQQYNVLQRGCALQWPVY